MKTDIHFWSYLAHFFLEWEMFQTDFHEIWYLSIFRASVEKIQIILKSDDNNRHFTWRPIYIFDHISLIPSWNEKCFIQKL